MLDLKYLSPETKTVTHIALIFLLFLSLVSCKSKTIWNLPIETVKSELKNANYSLFETIDFTEKSIREVLKLGNKAPYYFYYIFKDMDRPEEALQLLRLQKQKGESFIKAESLFLLLNTLIEAELYREAEITAWAYLDKTTEPRNLNLIKKAYIESLYWQHKDAEVLKHLSDIYTEAELHETPELLLFRAVSTCRIFQFP